VGKEQGTGKSPPLSDKKEKEAPLGKTRTGSPAKKRKTTTGRRDKKGGRGETGEGGDLSSCRQVSLGKDTKGS